MNAQNINAETKAMNGNINPAPMWARAAVMVCAPVLRFSKPILYTLCAVAVTIIGTIVVVQFAKLFCELALTISNLSIESTEGNLLVLAVYCTSFYVYIQHLQIMLKRFKILINSLNIEKAVCTC